MRANDKQDPVEEIISKTRSQSTLIRWRLAILTRLRHLCVESGCIGCDRCDKRVGGDK